MNQQQKTEIQGQTTYTRTYLSLSHEEFPKSRRRKRRKRKEKKKRETTRAGMGKLEGKIKLRSQHKIKNVANEFLLFFGIFSDPLFFLRVASFSCFSVLPLRLVLLLSALSLPHNPIENFPPSLYFILVLSPSPKKGFFSQNCPCLFLFSMWQPYFIFFLLPPPKKKEAFYPSSFLFWSTARERRVSLFLGGGRGFLPFFFSFFFEMQAKKAEKCGKGRKVRNRK